MAVVRPLARPPRMAFDHPGARAASCLRQLAALRDAAERPADGRGGARSAPRAERPATRGTRRDWSAVLLQEAGALAREAPVKAELEASRALVLDVIHNHDQLKLGLPGRKHPGAAG